MRYLSWDIGIRNLSYCILNYQDGEFKIEKWDIINLMEEDILPLCCNINQKGGSCKNKSKYLSLDKHYCGIHSRKIDNKKILKKRKAGDVKIIELNKRLVIELDKYPEFMDVDMVLIENQGTFNLRMVKISAFLHNYFVMRGVIDTVDSRIKNILFIPAFRKLKFYDGPAIDIKTKNKYTLKKKTSIEYCKYYVKDDVDNLNFFLSHGKKDDLAESFLNCLNYIRK